MQLFYFMLKTRSQIIPDAEGEELIDVAAARLHAVAVARQLMQHRESDTRGWRIQVCDDYLKLQFEVFFSEVDETFARLPSHVQASIENVVRTAAALNDAVISVQSTLNDVRVTLSRADLILSAMPGALL